MTSRNTNPFIDFEEFESKTTTIKSVEIKIPDFQIYTSKHDGFVPLQSLTKPNVPQNNTDKRSLRGCTQCRKMYKDEDNNNEACKYHPGLFKQPKYSSGTSYTGSKRWSCCKEEREGVEGCTIGPHKEDSRMSDFLNLFNVNRDDGETENETTKTKSSTPPKSPPEIKQAPLIDFSDLDGSHSNNNGGPISSPILTPSSSSNGSSVLEVPSESNQKLVESPKLSSKTSPRLEPIKHELTKSDTLQGLAIKYGVTVDEIKRANKLFSKNEMHARKFLIIPPTKNM